MCFERKFNYVKCSFQLNKVFFIYYLYFIMYWCFGQNRHFVPFHYCKRRLQEYHVPSSHISCLMLMKLHMNLCRRYTSDMCKYRWDQLKVKVTVTKSALIVITLTGIFLDRFWWNFTGCLGYTLEQFGHWPDRSKVKVTVAKNKDGDCLSSF